MQTVNYGAAASGSGAPMLGASVSVYLTGTTTFASLFDTSGAAIANPMTAGADGYVRFQVANGTYDIQATSGVTFAPNVKQQQVYDLAALATTVSQLQASSGAGSVGFATKSALTATLTYPANTMATVFADSTSANNGIYLKVGASGSGSWTQVTSSLYGLTPTFSVGSYAVAPGGAPTVAITGPASAPVITFGIPVAQFSVGTTTTLAGGASATVVLGGTSLAPTLNFGIPTGVTPNINIGTVTTVAYGSSPTVTISGPASAPTLSFGLPSGASGAGIAYKGAWSSGGTYTLGNVVTYSGNVYIANTATPSGTPGVSGSWDLFPLPASGSVGGALTGTLPNPGLSQTAVAQAALPRNPLGMIGAGTNLACRSLVFIGDSITASSVLPNGYSDGYVAQLVRKIAQRQNLPIPSLVSFADVDYLALSTSMSNGTTGPVKKSVIVPAGQQVQFTSDNVDFVKVFYAQSGTTTTVRVSNNFNTTTDTYTTATGSNPNVSVGFNNNHRAGKGVTFTIANTGSNPLELNGVGVYRYTASQGIMPQVYAYPGYTTSDFMTGAVGGVSPQITAICAQTLYTTNPVFVLALGTNNIYKYPSGATSSASYISDISAMCAQIMTTFPTATIVLTCPMIPYGASNVPRGGEPASNYYAALYAFAETNGYDVVDLSLLNMDFNAGQLYADNLHPSVLGNAAIANLYYEKLGLSGYEVADLVLPITLLAGFSQTGGFSPASIVVRKGVAEVMGVLNAPGTQPGFPVTIGTFDGAAAGPCTNRLINAAFNGPAGMGLVEITPGGAIILNSIFTVGGGWPAFLSLDGLSYRLDL